MHHIQSQCSLKHEIVTWLYRELHYKKIKYLACNVAQLYKSNVVSDVQSLVTLVVSRALKKKFIPSASHDQL